MWFLGLLKIVARFLEFGCQKVYIKMKRILLISLTGLLLAGCGSRTYQASNFDRQAITHQQIAVLPIEVDLELRPRVMQQLGREKVKEMELQTGRQIQSSFYNWVLRRGGKKSHIKTQFQDVDETNRILRELASQGKSPEQMSARDLCTALGVDALVRGKANLDQPISREFAAVIDVVNINTGLFLPGPPAQTKSAEIGVIDGRSGTRIWGYTHSLSGGTFTSSDDLIRQMMRNASRKFPYRA